jgi:hypothetical protein
MKLLTSSRALDRVTLKEASPRVAGLGARTTVAPSPLMNSVKRSA